MDLRMIPQRTLLHSWIALPVLGVIAALVWSMPGCSKTGTKSSRPAAVRFRIGFLMETYDLDRWQRDEQLFTARAHALGADVLRAVADGDQDRQNKQADAFLTQGVDVLVVVPKNLNTAARIVRSAHEKGVPVVAYDRLIRDCDLDLYVTFDNETVGYLQAKGILEKVPRGNYILLGGAASDNNARLLRDGQLRAIREHEKAAGTTIRILADPFMDNWDREEARRRIGNLLTKYNAQHTAVDAIVASNDATAGGAIAALRAEGRAGTVAVSGQDAELAACQRIVEGTQTLTVYKPVRLLAEASAEAAVRLARGEKPEGIIPAIGRTMHALDNGARKVPSVFLDPVAVTRDNIISTVVKDGWQSMENVFVNIPKDRWPRP